MTVSQEIPKEGTCSLCSGHYADYGHDPALLGNSPVRCCTECNSQLVLPERLRRQIPNPLEQRAAELDCRIDVMFDGEMEEGIDYGPYRLCDAESGAHVWGTGLPLERIVDALDCLERELQLPEEKIGDAWADFGSSWAARYVGGQPHG